MPNSHTRCHTCHFFFLQVKEGTFVQEPGSGAQAVVNGRRVQVRRVPHYTPQHTPVGGPPCRGKSAGAAYPVSEPPPEIPNATIRNFLHRCRWAARRGWHEMLLRARGADR
jgi:hypothetical protein